MGDATADAAAPLRALLMGVSRFAPAVAEDEEPMPGQGWDDLPFVLPVLARLEQAYQKLAYEVRAVREPDRRAVRQHWTAVDEEQYGIVHVVSHGTTAVAGRGRTAEGSERLSMVPSCGNPGFGTDVSLWVQEANSLAHPMLFVVDLCRAGRAARVAQLAQIPDDQLHAWVIAATGPDRAAYDGAFSTAVAEVLEGIAENGLDTSPSLRFVRWDKVTSSIQNRLSATGSRQKVHSTKVDTSQPLELPFFPNPNWTGDPRLERLQTVDAPVRAFVADLGAEHFMDRVRDHFVGRRRQLADLAPWLDDATVGGLRVVTGAPGSGKSALLGALVCTGHEEIIRAAPDIRRHLAAQQPDGVASPNPMLAAIHARNRELDAVLTSLAAQWRLPARGSGRTEPWTAPDLIEAIVALPAVPVLVFDALDEADDPADLMQRLLLPLTEALRPDGRPCLRLLVGTRRGTRFQPLLELAAAQQTLLDLDDVPDGELRADLAEHLSLRLAELPSYSAALQRPVRTVLARTVAAKLTRNAGTVRDWGPFLVARIFGRALETLPAPADVAAAEHLGASVPVTLPGVLELDLSLQPQRARLRAVLAAVAWAKGEGFPTEAVAAVAAEFAPDVDDGNVRQLLEANRFYLRTGVESDGSTLYRLFHQGLADYLQVESYLRPYTPPHPRPDSSGGPE
ncbi:ATP-binding protein [Streptomyces sp. NBC_00299]|uniref:ATP-binding protein n=1 Tax=Streptomyces sp. NBC_00299 TaxID=2975705 RepID=UPI002E2DC8DB|nr:ATP-binding protein [Streptomyces sp. NBC_00299]